MNRENFNKWLEVLRDPTTIKAERKYVKGPNCFCALGCLYKVMGIPIDHESLRFWFKFPVGTFERDWLDLENFSISEVINWNDFYNLSLPEIADKLEQKYANELSR